MSPGPAVPHTSRGDAPSGAELPAGVDAASVSQPGLCPFNDHGKSTTSPVSLSYFTVLSYEIVVVLQALEVWKQRADLCFSTSLPALDRLLQGGLPRGTLTEVVHLPY